MQNGRGPAFGSLAAASVHSFLPTTSFCYFAVNLFDSLIAYCSSLIYWTTVLSSLVWVALAILAIFLVTLAAFFWATAAFAYKVLATA